MSHTEIEAKRLWCPMQPGSNTCKASGCSLWIWHGSVYVTPGGKRASDFTGGPEASGNWQRTGRCGLITSPLAVYGGNSNRDEEVD